LDRDGYGAFTVDGKKYKAHRLAFELATGADPTGLLVCHHCDTPSCVNPDHLFLGTQADNLRDMTQKERHQFGSQHHSALISDDDVLAIRDRRAKGEKGLALAAEFGLSQASISDIYHGRTWRHVA
jgi:hypothetical protein